MYALLGNIRFEGAYGPAALQSKTGANYAEHALIEGKPRLQKVGDNLEELTLRMQLHKAIVSPEEALAQLYRYQESGEIVPLIFGNGLVYAQFVVTSVELVFKQQTGDGTIVSATANVVLKEAYNPRQEAQSRASAFAVVRNSPVLATPLVLAQGVPAVFMQDVNAAIVETEAVNAVLAQAETDPSLEAFALADAGKRLDKQKTALQKADALASDTNSVIHASTAAFRAETGAMFAQIDALKIALGNGLAPSLNANFAYQTSLNRLRGLTTEATSVKALRR